MHYQLLHQLILFEFPFVVVVNRDVGWCLWIAWNEHLGRHVLVQLLVGESLLLELSLHSLMNSSG